MRYSLFLVILTLTGLLVGCGKEEEEAPQAGGFPEPVFPITVAEVERGTIVERASLVGSIRYAQRIVMKNEIAGTVLKVTRREGDTFKKGELLLLLDDGNLKVKLAQEEASLEQSKRRLADLKAGTRQEVLDRLSATVDETKARLMQMTDELNRAQNLYDQKVGTEAELIRARANKLTQEAILKQHMASLAEARSGTRPEEIEVAAAEVRVREAMVAAVKHDMTKNEVKAPFDGVMLLRRTEAGTYLDAGSDLMEVASTTAVIGLLEVPEQFAVHVKPGIEFELRADAIPNRVYHATVSRVIPLADETSRSVYIRTSVTDADESLIPGMFVRAALPVTSRENVLLVPQDAITLKDGKNQVFEAKEDGTIGMHVVQLGITSGGKTELIETDLTPGAKVVTTGGEVLFPGAKYMIPGAGGPGGPPAGGH